MGNGPVKREAFVWRQHFVCLPLKTFKPLLSLLSLLPVDGIHDGELANLLDAGPGSRIRLDIGQERLEALALLLDVPLHVGRDAQHLDDAAQQTARGAHALVG